VRAGVPQIVRPDPRRAVRRAERGSCASRASLSPRSPPEASPCSTVALWLSLAELMPRRALQGSTSDRRPDAAAMHPPHDKPPPARAGHGSGKGVTGRVLLTLPAQSGRVEPA
jgi:hypothetical protein